MTEFSICGWTIPLIFSVWFVCRFWVLFWPTAFPCQKYLVKKCKHSRPKLKMLRHSISQNRRSAPREITSYHVNHHIWNAKRLHQSSSNKWSRKCAMTRAPPTDGESCSHPLLNNANETRSRACDIHTGLYREGVQWLWLSPHQIVKYRNN